KVTGVQTCALPISARGARRARVQERADPGAGVLRDRGAGAAAFASRGRKRAGAAEGWRRSSVVQPRGRLALLARWGSELRLIKRSRRGGGCNRRGRPV